MYTIVMNDNSSKNTSIIATFTYAIYRSADGNFCAYLYRTEDGKKIKCIGSNLPEYKGIKYEFTGEYGTDKNGKEQFNVFSFTEHVESTKESIVAYLSSGTIKGIGKKTAERIYEMYKEDSLNVIESSPENLLRVRGITPQKLDCIIESYRQNHLPQDVIELLLPLGFTTNLITRICRTYKGETYSNIESNPYDLCTIRGVSFEMADNVGRHFKIDIFDRRRIYAAITEAIKVNYFKAKVGATIDEINREVSLMASISDKKFIWKMLVEMINAGRVTYKKLMVGDMLCQYFYMPQTQNAEENLAKCIIANAKRHMDESIRAEKLLEKSIGEIKFDDTQRMAIINAFKHSLSIITGGPGTGKTTILKKIVDINKELNKKQEVVLLAPTGKAARRISESTKMEAKTIHSQFLIRPREESSIDTYNTGDIEKLKDALVIIDEFSMVDMMLALLLFQNVENCRIVIVGDPDQLQSVGAGNVLKDMIDCGTIPVTRLIYEHRQQKGSKINDNANGMQRGLLELEEGEDFACRYIGGSEDILKDMEDAMVEAYLSYKNDSSISSVVCLCPYKKYQAGIYSVNSRLQEILNPLGDRLEVKGMQGMKFRENDPVMHVNTNTEQVSNGNVGVVERIKKKDKELIVVVRYDLGSKEELVEYGHNDMDQLCLAYAMTIHKSQGSEYDAVVTCLSSFHRAMLKRSIPYTAITRAKKSVTFFADSKETIKRAILNNSTEDRNTLLSYTLKQSSAPAIPKKEPEKKVRKTQCDGQMTFAFA